jgi:peptidoglycan/LPS O-acetylase OafA/YrhL
MVGDYTLKRQFEFDFMRSIAILLILLTHLPGYGIGSLTSINEFFHVGHLGLGLFIFMSGYLLYATTSNLKSGNIFSFYKKKLIRIYPLYLIALISFFITFELIFKDIGFDFALPFKASFTSYLIHFLGAQVLLAPEYVTPILTLWYIGLILLYYLLYPVLVIKSRNLNDIVLRSIFIVVIFAALHVLFNIIEVRFFYYYFVFITGIISSHKNIFSNMNFSRFIPIMLILYISTFPVFRRMSSLNIFGEIFIIYMLVVPFIFLTYYAGRKISQISSVRLQNFFLLVSTSSYCVYLFHRPILALFYSAGLMLNPYIGGLAVLLLGIPATFVIGYYIQISESKLLHKK